MGFASRAVQGLDLLLVVPPTNRLQVMPELGPAQIAGHLTNLGMNVLQLDLNQEFLKRHFRRDGPAWGDPLPQIATSYDLNDKNLDKAIDFASRDHPLYREFFSAEFFEPWLGPPPRALGISILSASQILPSLRLGAMARQHFGDIPIIWGGPYAVPGRNLFSSFVLDESTHVDAFCLYGGERAMEVALSGGGDPRSRFAVTPGLVFAQSGGVQQGPPPDQMPLDELGAPSFEGLCLESYPARQLPIPSLFGCYHQKCCFCHHRILRPHHDSVDGASIADRIVDLRARYGIDNFFLADHATRAKTMVELARSLMQRDVTVRFSAMARAEKEFTQERLDTIVKGGGKVLFVGLEVVDDEMLRRLRKGVTVAQVEGVCQRATKAGLKIVLFIIDLPSMSVDDVLKTVQWTIDRSDIIHDVVYQRFKLSRDILYFDEFRELGMEPTLDPDSWVDVYDIPYRWVTPRSEADEGALADRLATMGEVFREKRRIQKYPKGADLWWECTIL